MLCNLSENQDLSCLQRNSWIQTKTYIGRSMLYTLLNEKDTSMSLCVPMGLSKSKCVHRISILWPIQHYIFKFELTLDKTKKHSVFPVLLVLFFFNESYAFCYQYCQRFLGWHTVQYILMFNISGCFSLQHMKHDTSSETW